MPSGVLPESRRRERSRRGCVCVRVRGHVALPLTVFASLFGELGRVLLLLVEASVGCEESFLIYLRLARREYRAMGFAQLPDAQRRAAQVTVGDGGVTLLAGVEEVDARDVTRVAVEAQRPHPAGVLG